MPTDFKVGRIYRIKYVDNKDVTTKRNVVVTTQDASLISGTCLSRCRFRRFTIANIKKAKDITSRLDG